MDYQLASGAKLTVSQAPFVDAMALQKALLAAAKGLPMAADIMKMDVAVLKDVIIAAATSPEVEKALFQCAARATYDSVRVDPDLFDDAKIGTRARADFYEIAWKIIEVNCGPFFKTTFSRLKAALPAAPAASPK
jgi:hypothetical protein